MISIFIITDLYLVKDFGIYFGTYILCLFCLQMDPNGIVPDETSSANGCNGCLTKGSEVRVNMDEPENPAMVNLAHMGSLQG